MVWEFCVVRPVAMVQFQVEADLEPTQEFGTVARTNHSGCSDANSDQAPQYAIEVAG
jgi:hypothetical protein